jgi:hypothetical protein
MTYTVNGYVGVRRRVSRAGRHKLPEESISEDTCHKAYFILATRSQNNFRNLLSPPHFPRANHMHVVMSVLKGKWLQARRHA